MNAHAFDFASARLAALPTGALWWADERLLVVSDLHLGKSERVARRAGQLLPPYETRATLDKLAGDIGALDPAMVVCLGDSFDDLAAAQALDDADRAVIIRMQAGRRWIWIEGNHDPGPVEFGGSHLRQLRLGPLVMRHIADGAHQDAGQGEVSGHFHPKYRVPGVGPSRPAFIYDQRRLVMPAYGVYTGGLSADTATLAALFGARSVAVLTGRRALAVPFSGSSLA
jgi:DNA ligase-associated metallophosphoesterase